jgi:Protein of unknown function (DUF3341)
VITYGIMAEFGTPEGLLCGLRELRALGFDQLDAFTPYPIREILPLLRVRRSPLPRWVLAAGLAGAASAYLLEWWCAAASYPVIVGGRPLHSAPAFVPIAFESGILAACVTAFVSVILYARLLRLYDPVFETPGFERASIDRFWIAAFVDAARFPQLEADEPRLRSTLERGGAIQVLLFARLA